MIYSLYARCALCAMLGVGTAACATQPASMPDGASGTDVKESRGGGGWRTEPVIFNGRRYAVSFRNSGSRTRQVKVSAPGRKLGVTRGDGKVVAQIASSTVAHFTCKSGKARVRAGTARPTNGHWRMLVDCL